MTENDYIELNQYLKEYNIYLKHNKPFIIDNLDFFYILSSEYIKATTKSLYIEKMEQEKHYSIRDSLTRTAQYLKKINPIYERTFIHYIKNGKIQLQTSKCTEKVEKSFSTTDKINIPITYGYKDTITLIHEFWHDTNLNTHKEYMNRNLFSEFISIFFESYYLERYLKNRNTIEYINFKKIRIQNTRRFAEYTKYIAIYLKLLQIGHINKKTILYAIDHLEDENIQNLYQLEIVAHNLLMVLKEKGNKIPNPVDYIIGFALTEYIFASKTITKEYIDKILKFNQLLNSSLPIPVLLNIIDIDITEENIISYMIESIQNRIQEYSELVGSNTFIENKTYIKV